MSIEIKNLTYTYGKDPLLHTTALHDINLTIDGGEIIGLIGHTGSGKSTLVQHLNALLKPTSGQVFIDGADINADKKLLKQIRKKVGLVFQYPEHQLFEISVYKDVMFGPANYGVTGTEADAAVREALSIVGIAEDLYEKSPFELSGGQKRRVSIAGVLAMKPDILILDEPTAGLDPKGRDELFGILRNLRKNLNITVIIVSHSMDDMAAIAERLIVLHNGRVAFDASPREVFAHAGELEQIGLAAPQMSYLVKAIKREGFAIDENIFTVDEAVDGIYKLLKGV